MPNSTVYPFRYRMIEHSENHLTFYAPDRATADRYARRWARRLGYSRVVRLKPSKAS